MAMCKRTYMIIKLTYQLFVHDVNIVYYEVFVDTQICHLCLLSDAFVWL